MIYEETLFKLTEVLKLVQEGKAVSLSNREAFALADLVKTARELSNEYPGWEDTKIIIHTRSNKLDELFKGTTLNDLDNIVNGLGTNG